MNRYQDALIVVFNPCYQIDYLTCNNCLFQESDKCPQSAAMTLGVPIKWPQAVLQTHQENEKFLVFERHF